MVNKRKIRKTSKKNTKKTSLKKTSTSFKGKRSINNLKKN